MKKIKIPLIISACVVIIAMLYYLISHSIYWKYNDWWILGKFMPFDASKTYEEIENRYGEFDLVCSDCDMVGYYLYTDEYGDKYYYLIKLNPKDRVDNIYIGTWESE